MWIIAALAAFALSLLYITLQWNHNYWKKKKVPHAKPTLLFGNYKEYMTMNMISGQVAQKICQEFPNEPYIGAFYGTKPALIIQDPELIKLVTTKDFYYFNSREIMDHTQREEVGYNLFFTFGDRWKVLRQNMTPLFSSAKMRNMFHLIEKCSHTLEDMLDEEVKISHAIDARCAMVKYTMDCICSCGFGIETNTMKKSTEKNSFTAIGEAIFGVSNLRGYFFVARQVWPSLFYGVGLQAFPKVIHAFFSKVLTSVFDARQYKPTSRNDFIDLILSLRENKYITGDSLMNAKTKGEDKVRLEVDDGLLVAQGVVFFAAGFETSASTLGFTLYELAKDQNAQRRAIEEVDDYLRKHKNKLNYDCVHELAFLSACIDEALRMYPVLGIINREVFEEYTLPSGVTLEKGLRIHLPVYHLHHNPEYFPDPEQYRPERFLPENKHTIKPYTYMPFGEGPRICIGMRFSRMQTLSGLLTVFKKFRVELAEGMPEKLELDPRAFVTAPKSGIHLRLVEREGWEQRQFSRS